MLFQKHILSMAAVLAIGAIGALPAFASQAKPGNAVKATASKTHVAHGSVVASTNDSMTIRSGKKDMSFKINSTTQKPTTMTPGSNVTVNYHDDGNQHIANSIELAPTKPNATAARSPASK